jgi:hypothetical protein
MGDDESQIGITVEIKEYGGKRANAKRNLLTLSHRWRERSRTTLTTANWLKQEKEGNNDPSSNNLDLGENYMDFPSL